MLIDATHEEETRVVILDGKRIADYDAEIASKRPLKGNIYLAKVTRVEPSLQAAFVEYGGNRHGFLSFNEIHPDYYRIPISDREKLIEEESGDGGDEDGENGEAVETVGGDELEDMERRRVKLQRRYKIQEVIKRRQIILVQVVKEERGTKGAALTTYLSLAGRYCVLMPNTVRGGGISRKITNARDRKRLKGIVDNLGVPDGMAVILRTAGSERSKVEVKRDYEYLFRLWGEIRELTLASTAPALVHEEGNLIKRTIRDLYSKEIDEILVEGDGGYKIAKDFMRTLIPSHAKKVKKYSEDGHPLMQRFQAESQLDAIHSPTVQLKSGGYIVIHQTEALVAIDVNSGRATRERHIEETALKTNSEAADEIARQLRLRDLAGLIVIDFIDMDENRNNHSVERRFKDALRQDRARIQIGRISPFGLLEMSRQRLRASLIEITGDPCPHCNGTGFIQSTDWTALQVLRAIEEEGLRKRAVEIEVAVSPEVAIYLLNQKRQVLTEIEASYEMRILMRPDSEIYGDNCAIEVLKQREGSEEENGRKRGKGKKEETDQKPRRSRRRSGRAEETAEAEESKEETAETAATADDEDRPKRRRRRGRRGGRRRGRRTSANGEAREEETAEGAAEAGTVAEDSPPVASADENAETQPEETAEVETASTEGEETADTGNQPESDTAEDTGEAAAEKPAPARRRRTRSKKAADEDTKEKPKRARRPRRRKTATDEDASEKTTTDLADADAPEAEAEGAAAKEAPDPETPEASNAEPDAPATPPDTEEAVSIAAVAATTEPEETPLANAVEDDAPASEEPARRGWWQRA
jgi:ribonuclease E